MDQTNQATPVQPEEHENLTDSGLPLGLGMAFAQNVPAMERFSALSPSEQQDVIARAKTVRSREEMQSLVDGLGNGFGNGVL